MAKRVLKNILKNGNEYEVGNIKLYVITENMVTVSTDDTKGEAPYNTSYGYTDITINENAGIKWKEGAVYCFVINTSMVVASANRNVRIRIGTSGDWKPLMGSSSSIIAGSSYFVKNRSDLRIYKTTQQSNGALHLQNDTSYSAMSVAEGTTGTATSARTMRADYLKQIIQAHSIIPSKAGNQTITNTKTGSGDTTPLSLTSKGSAGSCFIAFNGKDGFLASYGVDSNKKPQFYNGNSNQLAIISGAQYGSGWSGVSDKSPSQNAVYNKIEAMDTTISGKADSSSLGTASAKDTGTSSGNVPVIGSNGKLDTSIIPDVHSDAVSSVNTKTGAVVLNADDISDTSTTNKFVTSTEKSTWNGKQNALSTQTAYTSKGSATKVPQITTNTLGQVTGITEVTITQPDISGKANTSDVLTKTNTTSYTPSGDYNPATKKYVDDAVSQAGGGVDHLESNYLVGELYTLSDSLFSQNTPKTSDCTLNANIGDVASNTQIHIQRIGSGTASNKLKLYVKSVGSPTTGLVVEVRQGVQVTVTANKESYWYGNTLIASGNIASGSITSNYAEIEVTMNGNFGGTKGELLDVVVYQTNSTVNASNYYCLACDSTQYGEAFSYVSVNGTTRTRSYLMPYCISGGFAQTLLAKLKECILWQNTTGSVSGNNWFTAFSATPPAGYSNGLVRIYNAYNRGMIDISQGGAAVYRNYAVSGSSTNPFSVDSPFTSNGGNMVCQYSSEYGSSIRFNVQVYLSNGPMPFIPSISPASITPSEVKSLGETLTCFLYGIDSDGIYKGGLITGKSTTASTGSISLGNAVGYLEITYNGELVKIPYYT